MTALLYCCLGVSCEPQYTVKKDHFATIKNKVDGIHSEEDCWTWCWRTSWCYAAAYTASERTCYNMNLFDYPIAGSSMYIPTRKQCEGM